jgi:pimeloyl-ACP methyl ester carboxylesterase
MIIKEFIFLDQTRNRQIPTLVYLPTIPTANIKTVIYAPGYEGQQELAQADREGYKWPYKNHHYLAEFFTNRGYAFVTIQHDMLGDNDGLETLDPKALQAIARGHLWERGVENTLFVIAELKKQQPALSLDKFIIGGHSNGGDIAKYFANNHPQLISHVIVCDGRRCPIATNIDIKILMFEASDTSTDLGVIPSEGTRASPQRFNAEWMIIKPKDSLHVSYCDDGEQVIKNYVCRAIDWFLEK